MQSPNFPEEYDNNAECKNLIGAPAGHQVRLIVDSFDLEGAYDFLAVYDGPDDSSQLIGTYSGKRYPWTISSSGRYLYVVFTSDKKVTYSGYHATVSFAGKHAHLAIHNGCLSTRQHR